MTINCLKPRPSLRAAVPILWLTAGFAPAADRPGALLMRSQDGVHLETNSLSLRSGERVRERGAREIRDRFQAMFSRLSPLPARSSRGEGEEEAPPAPLPLSPILRTPLNETAY